jgi:predicted kinase
MTETNKPILVLIRGLPGSGKSFAAQNFFVPLGFEHIELDQYFYNDQGEFNYNYHQLEDAKRDCGRRVEDSLRNGKSVVVSNCMVDQGELRYYYGLARRVGANLHVLRSEMSFESDHYRIGACYKMAARFCPAPAYYDETSYHQNQSNDNDSSQE